MRRKKRLRKFQGNTGSNEVTNSNEFDLNMQYLNQNFTPAEIDTITGGMYTAGSDYLGYDGWGGDAAGRLTLDAASKTGMIPSRFAELITRGKQGWKSMGKKSGINDVDAMRVLLDAGVPKAEILKWFREQGVGGDIFPALSTRMDDYWSDNTRKRGGSVGTKKIFKKGGNVGGAGGWSGKSVPGMKHGGTIKKNK